jgi:pimeloyl-ACP methyl ester carboxylesterase
MTDQVNKKRRLAGDPLVVGAVSVGTLFVGLLSWIGYSALRVNHKRTLAPAIDAERKTMISDAAGLLSYYADARGTGTPLVLIHSINAAASAFEMRPIFEHYRGSRPVYALDLPGFGFSDRAQRPYSPEMYTAAIRDFLAKVVQQPADVVALSLGSEFAAMVALSDPALVRSLVTISPSGFQRGNNPEKEAQSRFFGKVAHGLFTFPLWAQALFDTIASRKSIRGFLQLSFEGNVNLDMVTYAYDTAHQPGAKHAPLYFIPGLLFTKGVRQRVYEKLTMPALVLYDRDPYVTFEMLQEAQTRNPKWQAERIAPTRGLPHWEKPEDTFAAMDRFWGSV